MSGNVLYEEDDSGCPDAPISLKAYHIRKQYKTLKKEMNTEIVDYLVQSYILTTDENSSLLDKSRAEKCDFILRRLIRDSNCLKKLERLLHEEPKVDEFDCFRSLLCNTSPEPEILNSDKQGISSPPATPPRPRPRPSSSSSSSSSSILNKVYLIGNFLSNYFSVFPKKKINKK